jgi:1-phosphofructokinase family hexose kinase
MILCITPNPAIDRTLLLPDLVLGNVHRAQKVIIAAGGKGLNVTRTIHKLGGEVLCMGFVGGHSGRLLADLAQQEGFHASWTWVNSETRTCTILVPQNGDATVINEPGVAISQTDWERLREDVRKHISSFNLACISGSTPPHSSAEDLHRLLRVLVDAGKQVWVDTSGPILNTLITYPDICLKGNGNEIGEILGFEVNDVESASRALNMMGHHGLTTCVITLGSSGALLATKEGRWHAQAPHVRVVSTVGSGDAFLGGLVNAQDRGAEWPDALREAAAAGTANALSAGGGQFTLQEFQEIRGQIQIQAL